MAALLCPVLAVETVPELRDVLLTEVRFEVVPEAALLSAELPCTAVLLLPAALPVAEVLLVTVPVDLLL